MMNTMCTKCAREPLQAHPHLRETIENIGAPGRDRTCDLRFRKPLLYPLSYGGGDGANCGAKFADTSCITSNNATSASH